MADFPTLADALAYAARGEAGVNFYSGRGVLLESLSYRELRVQALDYARRLLGVGLRPGDRVAIIAESDGDFARVFWACQYAGLIPAPLPLPLAFGGRETYVTALHRMIASARATAAFAPEMLVPWLREATGGLSLRLFGTLERLREVEPDPAPLPTLDPEGLSYLQFSSGSTRFPLGVAVTQRAVMANAGAISRHGLAIRDGDRGVSWLPLYPDMGLVGFFLTPLACQVTVDLLPTREFARRPLVWLDLISRNRGTLAYSPSFGYELCTRRAESAAPELDLSCWRAAGIGGDMIRPKVLADFAARFEPCGFRSEAFVASYGMAEATLALSFGPLDRGIRTDAVVRRTLEHQGLAVSANVSDTAERSEFVRCGTMLPGHQVGVRDERDRVLPERRVGTLFVRGPSIMRGYDGHREETRRVLATDGWLNTGDLGYVVDREIVITGRVKDLIIVNGRNIWPQDLEYLAEQQPEVRPTDASAFSISDEDDGEIAVLVVQCRETDPPKLMRLGERLQQAIHAEFGIHCLVELVPPHTLPRTSSGKLSRSRARLDFLERRKTQPDEAPRTWFVGHRAERGRVEAASLAS
jgi:fatty-acyl-CoA synthase